MNKSIIVVVIAILAIVLISNSLSDALAKPKQPGPISCRYAGDNKVQCCQDRPGKNNQLVTWCTICIKGPNDNAPHDCLPRYCVNNCAFANTNIQNTSNPPTKNNIGKARSPLNALSTFSSSSSKSNHLDKTTGLSNKGGGSGTLKDNSPTPPACPDKGPIPPNCTMKPKF